MLKPHDAKVASKTNRNRHLSVSLTAVAMAASGLFAVPVLAQTTPQPVKAGDDTVIVVTGFRGSLQTAISSKKKEDSIVDVIKSEDIAQFPDLNLAESLQRIPGVAIDRDGGEGRTITVRGLNSDFTRVRLNGMEAQATTGGKDSSGGANRGLGSGRKRRRPRRPGPLDRSRPENEHAAEWAELDPVLRRRPSQLQKWNRNLA